MVDNSVRGRAAVSEKKKKGRFKVGHFDVKGQSHLVSNGSVFSQGPGSEQGVAFLTFHKGSTTLLVNNSSHAINIQHFHDVTALFFLIMNIRNNKKKFIDFCSKMSYIVIVYYITQNFSHTAFALLVSRQDYIVSNWCEQDLMFLFWGFCSLLV